LSSARPDDLSQRHPDQLPLWRCLCVVVQEARQEPNQLVAFGLGQWREQVVLDGGD
jgi:hypothetical protein